MGAERNVMVVHLCDKNAESNPAIDKVRILGSRDLGLPRWAANVVDRFHNGGPHFGRQ